MAYNCPQKAQRLKETVSKAVGIIMDRHHAQELERQESAPMVPVTGVMMPEYALTALQDLQAAKTQDGQAAVMQTFAADLAKVCMAHPEDSRALYYLQRMRSMDAKMAQELAAEGITDRVLAERIARVSRGVQVGDRGVA